MPDDNYESIASVRGIDNYKLNTKYRTTEKGIERNECIYLDRWRDLCGAQSAAENLPHHLVPSFDSFIWRDTGCIVFLAKQVAILVQQCPSGWVTNRGTCYGCQLCMNDVMAKIIEVEVILHGVMLV